MTDLPKLQHYSSDDILDVWFRKKESEALAGGPPIHHRGARGHCASPEAVDAFRQEITKKLLSRTTLGEKGDIGELWACGEGVLSVQMSKSQGDSYYATIDMAHPDLSVIDNFIDKVATILTKRPGSSNIMILSDGARGLSLNSIGQIDDPLIKENYSEGAMMSYEHTIKCLKTNSPCGRFVLLSGPPGSGKSYLIRAITSEIEALFVLVPAGLANQLTGPSILPLLANYKNSESPIILIIEDADVCITKESRSTNPGGLSDILNLGDGLFGQLADVRILATSNADKMDLDPAMKRPGRMCQHVMVGYLSVAEAIRTYKNITGNEPPEGMWKKGSKKITLAEVYRRARADGWEPEVAEKTIGFDVDDDDEWRGDEALDRLLSHKGRAGF